MSSILPLDGIAFDLETDIVVVGAGACGLCAALAARDDGADVIVLERDASPSGSTSLSSGLIPACPTRYQHDLGIDDSPELLASDIITKTKGLADGSQVKTLSDASGPAIEWLADAHGFDWVVQTDFLYPQHSRHRMHAVPEMTGAGLMARLLSACEKADVTIACRAPVSALIATDKRIHGVRVARVDGALEHIGCKALILACNGFGGNPAMVRKYIPEMSQALYFGHAGNRGDAIVWGAELGAAMDNLGAYQGHGSVAHPHGILISWGLMMAGAIQVNSRGERFSNEHLGYSEQAVAVLDQPDGIAWNIYDQKRHELGLTFEDYKNAYASGALSRADTPGQLARVTGLPEDRLENTLAQATQFAAGTTKDPFGRDFTNAPALAGPYWAVRVTGALFHTQGGLAVDAKARVLDDQGWAFDNLYAGGGAANGVSGPGVWGYLSGNGLLSAVTLGRIAGHNAAADCAS